MVCVYGQIAFQIEQHFELDSAMNKDIHGFVNLTIGTLLALSAGIYYTELPLAALAVVGVSSAFLILRECWVFGGRVRWSLASHINQ